MTSINVTNARKRLYGIIDEVNLSHEPIHITGKKSSAVILSEDDWNAITETLYLSQFPGMPQSIKKGLSEPIKRCVKEMNW